MKVKWQFPVIGFIICICSFLLSASSKGFHDFFLQNIGIHPLLVTIIAAVLLLITAMTGIITAKDTKASIINLVVLILTLMLLLFVTPIFLFGNYIDSL
ncbi:hypothetical protein [Lentibacillus sediminis]|uniref:hypothetical protein n=1 Tax=Lentibacillus sediminis TaxID=1940529 RepID=UPI000C1C68AD|nr:hypothetical protein [Lentibacillus sediminis]